MRIEIDKLAQTDGVFAHHYADGELNYADERVRLSEPPVISGRVLRKSDQIVVKGRLSAKAEIDCDRCLKPIEVPVSVEFSLPYITARAYETLEAAELEEADLNLSVFDGEAIEIDEVAGEQLSLALPQHMLCREDCQGLCPSCGADRNLNKCDCHNAEIDPRWAALKKIVNGQS